MQRIKAAKRSDLPGGSLLTIQVGESQCVTLCNVSGEIHAIDAICPHRQAILGHGVLENRILTCPWHQWQFDVTTGKGITNPCSSVKKYEVELTDEEIYLLL
jgi:nitrite reductase/ring-hydroxylating ferredoxin subunit